jgi:tetratricopeptide (TPR) repeat protein
VLEQAQTQEPSELAWQQIGLAEIAEEQGDLDRAEAIYVAMLADPDLPADEADPVSAGLARVRMEPLAEVEDPGEAEWQALQQAQVLLDTDPEGGAGELERLREAQNTEVRIQALLVLAGLALDQGQTQGALADLAEAQQATQSDNGVWQAAITSMRVQAMLEMGEREQAVQAWEQALDRSAGNEDLASQAGLGLGELALSAGQPEEAQGYFEGVLSSAQDRGWKDRARLGRARARIDAGDFSGAQEDLERVLLSEEAELVAGAQELLGQLPD